MLGVALGHLGEGSALIYRLPHLRLGRRRLVVLALVLPGAGLLVLDTLLPGQSLARVLPVLGVETRQSACIQVERHGRLLCEGAILVLRGSAVQR